MFKHFISIVLAITWISVVRVDALPDVIYVGGLFDTTSDSAVEMAFRYSMQIVNANRQILTRSQLSRVPPGPGNVDFLPPNDSFIASKKVCQMIRYGVAAIIGPQSEMSADHVQSMCQTMKIPHIQTHWDPKRTTTMDLLKNEDQGYSGRKSNSPLSVNLYPHPAAVSRAYADVIKGWRWKSFTVLYEDEDGLIRLQELLQLSKDPDYKITVRQLPDSDDYRPLLKEMKKMGERNIVLDCSQLGRVSEVLQQAQQVSMTTLAQSYFITSLDMHILDYEEYKQGGANITGLRMINPYRRETIDIVNKWNIWEMSAGKNLNVTEKTLTLEAALVHDAVQLLAKALHDMGTNPDVMPRSFSCDGVDSWSQGNMLVNFIKTTEIEGLSGTIKFDSEGSRSNFNLSIVELQSEGLTVVGAWNSIEGPDFYRLRSDGQNLIQESLFNKTLVVSTILSNPYFMMKDSDQILKGNDQYEGFVFDIIDEISEMLGFHYKFKLVDDSNWGTLNKRTGEWNGMIRELLDGKADLAIADLSINYDRESAVDFTMPFLNTGISILYKKPQKKPPNLFSFLSPLSVEVWIYMCTAYLAVSLALYAMSRITPYEWNNPHPCRQQPDMLENNFTILNAMWFTIGSLMQQGSDVMPKATSTRMVAGLWWFFTLIMISSYTANLAAFLTVNAMDSPISSAEDLAKQTKIKYGSVGSGSTLDFFRYSTLPTQQRMWTFMETTRPSVFVKSNMEGVERVQRSNGQYAFLMESTSIEFFTERRCDLVQIGVPMDSKGYGIAMRPGSPFRAALSQAVLKMQETNRLLILKKKWWTEMRGGGACKDDGTKSAASAAELGLANVGGIFVVLILGSSVALLIAMGEFVWKSRKLALDEVDGGDGSVWKSMMSELKITLDCSSDTKPTRSQRSLTNS
ncbi:glutamate receptor ionotropic, kainate 2-like [Daphnia carinata]|uniref:glutamate receptor ionotropic, kainate 2-like n=1 Tax=Daphnia carinata TaxID=120202 RepID=UPI00257D4B4C|nr:glutamate receptor ionotropic, kainate 2-like [Daphnia carinata]